MLVKEGCQGTNCYADELVEKFRYNPYRKKNREIAEESYKENKILPFPCHIVIEVTSICNLKCDFCNREVITRPQMNMDMEVFKRVVDECAENGVYSLSLYCLGEPFINPNLRDMIIYAKGRGIPYVDVSTNGMFDMTPVIGTGLNELIISIDGNKKTHEALRKGAKYDTILHNIKELKKAKKGQIWPLIRIQAIKHFIGEKNAERFIKYWINKCDVVYIKNLEVMPALGATNLPQEEIDKRLQTRQPCKQLYFVLTVTSDGNICYCCHDPKSQTVLGNIKDKSLSTSWIQMAEMRENHRNGQYTKLCSTCVDISW